MLLEIISLGLRLKVDFYELGIRYMVIDRVTEEIVLDAKTLCELESKFRQWSKNNRK